MSDDLIASLKMFQDSMQGLAVNRAVSNATQTADAIRTSDAKEQDQRKQLDSLARDLSLKLTGLGAPATTVQNAFSAVAPREYASAGEALLDSNIKQNGVLGGAYQTLETDNSMREAQKSSDNARDIKKIDREGMWKRLIMDDRIDGKAAGSGSGSDDKVVGSLQTNMLKDKNYVAANTTLQAAADAKRQLQLALTNPAAKNDIPIIMSKLVSGGGRMNKAMFDMMGGSKAVLDRAAQAIQEAGKGTLSADNAKWMMEVADTAGESAGKNLHTIHTDYANKAAARTSLDLPTAYKKISGYDMPGVPQAGGTAPSGTGDSSPLAPGGSAIPTAPKIDVKKYLVN